MSTVGVSKSLTRSAGGLYNPVTDAWRPTSMSSEVPAGRAGHTAVWTGTEMIIWGGADGVSRLNTGGRYSPLTDSWRRTNSAGLAPEARRFHTAVWTGREMIIWGGAKGDQDFGSELRSGGRYDPYADTWTSTSSGPSAPVARGLHTAVYMRGLMVVWGGYTNTAYYLNTGARYDPSTDSWTPTSVRSGVPSGRYSHTAVVASGRMIVWGGVAGFLSNSGGSYDPRTDRWTPTSTSENVPSARLLHSSVSTGTDMIVWGGRDSQARVLNTGGRYDPVTDTWTPTSTGSNAPAPRAFQTAVWTGSEMIIWGGFPDTSTGGRYCVLPNGRVGRWQRLPRSQ